MAPRILYVVTEDWYFLSHRLPMARAAKAAGYEVHIATRLKDGRAAIEKEPGRSPIGRSESEREEVVFSGEVRDLLPGQTGAVRHDEFGDLARSIVQAKCAERVARHGRQRQERGREPGHAERHRVLDGTG